MRKGTKSEKKGEKGRNGKGEEKMGRKQEREKKEKWKREKGWRSEYASRIRVKTMWICVVSGLAYFTVYIFLFGGPDCSFVLCTSLLSFQNA